MKPTTIIDTCSAVGLDNAGVLHEVLRLPGRDWVVGPLVLDEANKDGASIPSLDTAISQGLISVYDGDEIGADKFLDALDSFRLGPGETECLVYAEEFGLHVCSDDGPARRTIASQIGDARVTGSIGLLKELVANAVLSPSEAFDAYERMVTSGSYLPKLDDTYFEVQSS